MQALGPVNALYPMPTTLVGTVINHKINFLAVAHVGILNHGEPQYLSIGLSKAHYSNQGIITNKSFSICLPNRQIMAQTDYCGIVTGKNTDKSKVFDTFFGEVPGAPMISECPVNMELKLHEVLDFNTHDIFIGELVQTYADPSVLTNGKIDMAKLDPLLFDMASKKYWAIGQAVGDCWREGKVLKR